MSNYSQSTFFTAKDTLPTTDPNKTIFGAAYDVEFGNISTAIATKYDVTNAAGVLVYIASNNTLTGSNTFSNTTTFSKPITVSLTASAVGSTITSTFSFAAATPGLSIRSTAVNGFATLSLAGNSNVVGTTDFALFQNGTDSSASVLNRANAALNLGANNATFLSIAAAGNVTINQPTSGVALTIYEGLFSIAAQRTVATFDQSTTAVNMTGGTTTPSVTVTYTRIGRQVFAQITATTVTYSAGTMTLPASVPVAYRPAGNTDLPGLLVSAGASEVGFYRVASNGDIRMLHGTGTDLSGTCGPSTTVLSWSL